MRFFICLFFLITVVHINSKEITPIDSIWYDVFDDTYITGKTVDESMLKTLRFDDLKIVKAIISHETIYIQSSFSLFGLKDSLFYSPEIASCTYNKSFYNKLFPNFTILKVNPGVLFFNKNDIFLYAPFTGGPSYFSPLLSSFVIKSNKYRIGKFRVGNSIYDIFNLDMIQKKYGEINSIIFINSFCEESKYNESNISINNILNEVQFTKINFIRIDLTSNGIIKQICGSDNSFMNIENVDNIDWFLLLFSYSYFELFDTNLDSDTNKDINDIEKRYE